MYQSSSSSSRINKRVFMYFTLNSFTRNKSTGFDDLQNAVKHAIGNIKIEGMLRKEKNTFALLLFGLWRNKQSMGLLCLVHALLNTERIGMSKSSQNQMQNANLRQTINEDRKTTKHSFI